MFISYRRDDSAGFAGRLTDALERRFGADSVFRDVDDIAAGADFGVVIEQALQQVQAVLVVIGPGWLEAAADGRRRLDQADDFVRREVESALASGKPVVPILVEDKANGPAVVSVMAAKIPGVIAVSPEGSKEARGSAVSPLVESGNVHLPYPYDNAGNVRPERRWVLEWIDEFERFPAEPNDRVDSFSQGVLRLMLQPTEGEQLGATDEHLDFENISDSLGDGVFNNLPGIGGGEEVFLD